VITCASDYEMNGGRLRKIDSMRINISWGRFCVTIIAVESNKYFIFST
jgi:hypothetical protein